MGHGRLFPLLFLLMSASTLVDVSSSLSFNIHFSHWGYDPQEVLFVHQTSLKNNSFDGSRIRMYAGHHDKEVVLRRKKRKSFVPKTSNRSRFDGLMYARPVLLRDEATDEVAIFKMTLCLRMDRPHHAGTSNGSSSTSGGGNHIGMFMFLVPYPWNRSGSDEGIEFGLNSTCTESSSLVDSDPVVCAHVHYDGAEELLKTNVRAGDRSCLGVRKIDRRRMPKEAAVGLASRIAGDPIKLENILIWAFHSTLESKDPPLSLPPHAPTGGGARGEQRLRLDLDPWNRNAELRLRYQRNWQQLRCSISVTLGCANNANEDTD